MLMKLEVSKTVMAMDWCYVHVMKPAATQSQTQTKSVFYKSITATQSCTGIK